MARIEAITAVLSRHRLMAAAVLAGALLRILLIIGYPWAFQVIPDSKDYLDSANALAPHSFRPFGFPALLAVLAPLDDLRAVYVVQHLAGLALTVAIYVFLVRRKVRRWLAVLAAAPILFDPMSISLEHFVMAETLFIIAVLAAVLLLLREAKPAVTAVVAGGLLLALAGLTRTVGLPLGVLVLGYLVVRRAGWRQCLAFGLAFTGPIAAYFLWFHAHYGVYGTALQTDLPLYGRVAHVVDCARLELTPQERALCPAEPLGQRYTPDHYWLGRVGEPHNPAMSSFNAKAIRQHPAELAAQWARETTYFFRIPMPGQREACLQRIWVPLPTSTPGCHPLLTADNSFSVWKNPDVAMVEAPQTPAAKLIRAYFAEARTPPLLLIAELVVIVAGALRWRRRLPRFAGPDGRDAAMAAVTGLALLALAVAGSQYDLRYGLPALPLLGIAAALAANRLLEDRRALEPDAGPQPPATATIIRQRTGEEATAGSVTAGRNPA